VRSVLFLPGFFWHAIRSREQVRRADGFIVGGLLADSERTFWTMTAWESHAAMLAFMRSGAHERAMPKLLEWCDEASVAGWQQEDTVLPGWDEADRRMRATGRVSKVRHPSAAQLQSESAGLEYRPARTTGAVVIRRD
jgi:hypothetical protein